LPPPGLTLDEFKARLPILEVVNARVKLTRRGRHDYWGCCPFHQEKTPSFHVRVDRGVYHCFGCGAHGNAIDFVMALDRLDFPEALERLAELTGIPAPRREGPAQPRIDRTLYDANEAAARWFEQRLQAQEGRAALGYLERRGLDLATLRRFRLGYAPADRQALKQALLARGFAEGQLVEVGLLVEPEGGGESFGRFRDRVMFPIEDGRGRIVGFGGRALGEARAKYLNTPETPLFHKGALLYNLARAGEAARRAGALVVVEGYMDVIGLARAGIDHGVAPLGTAITEEQLALLWKLADEPVLCLDGDEAGLRAAARAAERALPLLAPDKSLRFVLLPAGEDPDSIVGRHGAEALRRMLARTIPLVDFLWAQTVGGQPLDTPERRAGLEKQLMQAAQTIAHRSVREQYRRLLRQRLWELWRARGARPGASAPRLSDPNRMQLDDADVRRRAERRLVLPFLHDPSLLDLFADELLALDFMDARLGELRHELLVWHDGEREGTPELNEHLVRRGFADVLREVTGASGAGGWSVRLQGCPTSPDEVRALFAEHRRRRARLDELDHLEAHDLQDFGKGMVGLSRLDALLNRAPADDEYDSDGL
jgi:DNA primase